MNNEKTTFAERLKAAMNRRRISSAELCKRSGISKSSMSEYLSGKFMPKVDKLYAIATVLDASPLYLQGKIENEQPDELTAMEKELLLCFKKLNDAGQKTVILTIKSFTLNPEFSLDPNQAMIDTLTSPLTPDAKPSHDAMVNELRLLKAKEKSLVREAKEKQPKK